MRLSPRAHYRRLADFPAAGGDTGATGPRGLVLVPTRELASQVHEVLRPLADAVGLTVGRAASGGSAVASVSELPRPTAAFVPSRPSSLTRSGGAGCILTCPGRS